MFPLRLTNRGGGGRKSLIRMVRIPGQAIIPYENHQHSFGSGEQTAEAKDSSRAVGLVRVWYRSPGGWPTRRARAGPHARLRVAAVLAYASCQAGTSAGPALATGWWQRWGSAGSLALLPGTQRWASAGPSQRAQRWSSHGASPALALLAGNQRWASAGPLHQPAQR